MGLKQASIRRKLTALSMFTSSFAPLLACSGFFAYDLVTFRANMVNNLSAQAAIIGYNCASALLFHDEPSATNTLSGLGARPATTAAAVYAVNGKLFATARFKDHEGFVPAMLQLPTTNRERYYFDFDSLNLFQPIIFDGAQVGTVYIKSNLEDLKTRLQRYVTITLIVFMLSFFITVVISRLIGNRMLLPIVELVKTTKSVTANKDYSVRVRKTTEDEVGLLVETFNQMLAETEKTGAELKKSHDELDQRVHERTEQLETANKEALRLNQFLDSIIENIPNMLFVKSSTDLRFVRFNKAGEQLIGYERSALIGKNDYDFFPREEADFFTAKDRQVLTHNELVDIAEESIQTKDKGTRVLHTKKIPLPDETGTPQYLLGISEDITERKASEQAIKTLNEELRQKAAQLEASNKELESFSYSVSHDLRAPLRAIDGFSLALSEDCGETLPKEGQEHLQRIRAASQQMAQLIDDMLNLSRITRGTLTFESFDLSAIVEGIVADLRKASPDRKVTVEIEPKAIAHGDPRLLRIALENLLSNAWKFTAKAADAKIEFFTVSTETGAKTFCVRDNGAGFDMAYSNKLFGAFQRLHSTNDFSGTGIGLATVQRVINRHGGRVWAEARVGYGATFYFTLETPKL